MMFETGTSEKYPLGKTVILSYRGAYYSSALRIKSWLEETATCKEVVLFPPNSLCAPGELLLPYEHIELMEVIIDYLARCDSFVYLATQDYGDSYFTQAEMLQWRRFKSEPIGVPAGIDASDCIRLGSPQHWEQLSDSTRKMWASISVSINRNMQGHLSPAAAWGRFAKNCFLVPCERCGEHFLATQKAVYASLKGEFHVFCPHCAFGKLIFEEGGATGNYYRKPVSLKVQLPPNQRTHFRVLQADEILALLVENDAPPATPMVGLEGENPWSDTKKLLVTYGALAGIVAGVIGLASLFGGDSDDNENGKTG